MAPSVTPANGTSSIEQPQSKGPEETKDFKWDTRPGPPHQPSLTPDPVFPKTEAPEHKRYQEVLAYEDKWIGWDGPVWSKRYGRFENQVNAAADDGYSIKGGVPDEGLGVQHCEKHGCSCRVPFQHLSYTKDIQRRVEPMVESLIRLESQVGMLVHHLVKDGESVVHTGHGATHEQEKRYDEVPAEEGHIQRPREPIVHSLTKLENRVESLVHQVHQIMKDREERFLKYGQNLVPPEKEGKEKKHVLRTGSPTDKAYEGDQRQFYQGGR